MTRRRPVPPYVCAVLSASLHRGISLDEHKAVFVLAQNARVTTVCVWQKGCVHCVNGLIRVHCVNGLIHSTRDRPARIENRQTVDFNEPYSRLLWYKWGRWHRRHKPAVVDIGCATPWMSGRRYLNDRCVSTWCDIGPDACAPQARGEF